MLENAGDRDRQPSERHSRGRWLEEEERRLHREDCSKQRRSSSVEVLRYRPRSRSRRRELHRRRRRDESRDESFLSGHYDKRDDSKRRHEERKEMSFAVAKEKVCLDFLYNKCTRGDACKFAHSKDGRDIEESPRLLNETSAKTLSEINIQARQRKKPTLEDSLEHQVEIDQVLPLLEPLPDAYKEALLAIPGCAKHLDARHVKTLMRLSAKHAMAALQEFKDAISVFHGNIRNKGGYMMGVLRKYLPGELASGLTYDGSLLELPSGTADPYLGDFPTKKIHQAEIDPELIKQARRQDIERRQAVAAEHKSPKLQADLTNLIDYKLKEALRLEPKLNALYAWSERVNISEEELNPLHNAAIRDDSHASSAVSCIGAERAQTEYEASINMNTLEESSALPLAFASALLPLSVPALIDAIENPRHESAHPEIWTRRRELAYRYDARTTLIREIGARIAPLSLAHDRCVVAAWRRVPGRPNAWIRIRFSVTTAVLPPEPQKYQRAAVPIQAYLLEPISSKQTRCTTWGIEELQTPDWLQKHFAHTQKTLPFDFYKRLTKYLYLAHHDLHHDPVRRKSKMLATTWENFPGAWNTPVEQDDEQQPQ